MHHAIAGLEAHEVWRGRRHRTDVPAMATGHTRLDRQLPGNGWPLGALTELLTDAPGNGELSLLFPLLADVTGRGQWTVLVDPPWVPYPPAMHGHGIALERVLLVRTRTPQESLWACEQALRGVRGGAVLAWQDNPGFTRLRRLQLAAKAGHKAAFLFRPASAARHTTPAALRLQLEADASGIRIILLKGRGLQPGSSVLIPRDRHVPGGSGALVTHVPQTTPAPLRLDPQPPPLHSHAH